MFFIPNKRKKNLFFINVIFHLFFTVVIIQNLYSAPYNTFNVIDYGARGNGIHLDTKSIQSAIDDCAKTGGIVLFPAGKYLSGTIFMKSNVTLHISEGATLLGSIDIKDYPEKKPNFRSYTDNYVTQSLIYGEDLQNVSIIGYGSIDGQGGAFKPPTNDRADRYKFRPYIIRFITCQNVKIEDVTLKNSAMWMQHYLACDNVTIRGITVYNHCNMNNDMIDIDGCNNVIISDCRGDSDDDALTLKSTCGRPSENITITNCILSSHCNALKCGTESNGGFKNIAISNIVIKSSRDETPIFGSRPGSSGISLELVDGGILDGIAISNVRIDGPRVPIFLRLGNRARPYMEGMTNPPVGIFRNVNISNIIASGADTIGCSISGLPNHPIENVSLNNIRISYRGGGTVKDALIEVPEKEEEYPEGTMFGKLPSYGFYIRHVKGISLNNVDLTFENIDHRPALLCDDVQGLNISGFLAKGTLESKSLLILKNTQDVFIHSSRSISEVKSFLFIEGENTKRIEIFGIETGRIKNIYEIGNGVNEKEIFLNHSQER